MQAVVIEARYFFRAPTVQRAAALRLMLRNLQMAGVHVCGRGRTVEMRAGKVPARRMAVAALDKLYADPDGT